MPPHLLRSPKARAAFLTPWALTFLLLGCGETSPGTTGSGGAISSTGGGGSGGAPAATGGGAPASGGATPAGGAGPSGGGSAGGSSSAGGASGGVGTANGGALAAGGGLGAGGASAIGGSGDGGGGASSAGATVVPDPSWTCGVPDGLVDPSRGTLLFETNLQVGEVYDVGETQYGTRQVFDIQGGAIESSKLTANFLPGGLDLELTLSNGALEVEQVNMLRASDNSVLYLHSCGVALPGEAEARLVFDFEAANSSQLAWLNSGKFLGTRRYDESRKVMILAVYDVAEVTAEGPRFTLVDPAADLDQPVECSMKTGGQGATVFTETVTLGTSLSVGASKRGTRNVIPITGGTVTGQLEGKVMPGGADYQLIGGSTVLDARYTLKSNDGEFVVVRNCGAFGALVPWFEAKVDGNYSFLNEGEFVSSDPGSAAGGVKITFYERR